jgi:hypothetical protein
MSTASRMDRHREKAAVSRAENSTRKRKGRANRDKAMLEIIKKGQYPFTPAIMSWVSEKLNKPSSKVSETEVWRLVSS